jgi:hypothetical protein
MFQPSSDDERSPGKRLSIWVEDLTIADEAWTIMGAKPNNSVVACLESEAIRGIPAPTGFHPLRVEWELAVVDGLGGSKVPDTRPGAIGHAGIWGLIQGADNKTDKDKRRALRSALADVARLSPVPVPHDLSEDYLRIAAYYVAASHGECTCGPRAHWVMAIRQLRRERVRAERGLE